MVIFSWEGTRIIWEGVIVYRVSEKAPFNGGEAYRVFSLVQFSRSVLSDSLQPHEAQHARPPCPSPTPRVHSDSCPASQWCHPAISSSVVPSSSCPQSLPASESFPMSQLFAWGGQSTGVGCHWLLQLVPWPGIKPRPLHWEHGVLDTGPQGKSLL